MVKILKLQNQSPGSEHKTTLKEFSEDRAMGKIKVLQGFSGQQYDYASMRKVFVS